MIPLTAEQVAKVTGSTLENAQKYLPFIQGTCKAYDITSPRRVVGFLSQIGVESDGLATLTESLNYSTKALIEEFGRHRISAEHANKYGRHSGQKANQEMIANLIYGGKFGREQLGNTEPGDGWRFRGRGLKQLTGRANYAACSLALNEVFVDQPDRVLMPVNAALSAGWFWHTKGLNAIADRGDVDLMTRTVNGGYKGLAQRHALWDAGLEVFA